MLVQRLAHEAAAAAVSAAVDEAGVVGVGLVEQGAADGGDPCSDAGLDSCKVPTLNHLAAPLNRQDDQEVVEENLRLLPA